MLNRTKCLPHVAASLVVATQWGLFAGSVQAQVGQITVSTYVERDPEDSRHDLETWPYAIGTEDCENNVITRLSVNLPQQGTLEVWSGASSDPCNDENERLDAGCHEILSVYADETQAYEIELPARDISLGSCEESLDQEIKVFIALRDGGELIATGEWITLVDLNPPNPPSGVGAGIGESRLELEWTTPSGESVSGFRFYCAVAEDPPEGTGAAGASGAVGSSTATAGGAGAGPRAAGGSGSGAVDDTTAAGSPSGNTSKDGAATGSSCYSASLVAGERPGEGAWACGTVSSGSAVRGHTSRLDNDRTYAVSVVSVDEIGNRGLLSAPACQAPQELTDFFEAYRGASGRGGGGFCSVSSRRMRPAAALALGAAILGLLARRQRRGNRRAR